MQSQNITLISSSFEWNQEKIVTEVMVNNFEAPCLNQILVM